MELLLALSILVLAVAALATLALSADMASEMAGGHSLAAQHARIAVERMRRTVFECQANEEFPGAFVAAAAGQSSSDALVVWRGNGTTPAPTSGPRMSELVVYTVDPQDPRVLIEVSDAEDSRFAPPLHDAAAWRVAIDQLLQSGDHAVLTNLLAPPDGPKRARAFRATATLRPSDAELAAARERVVAWNELAWPQSIHSPESGIRQLLATFEIRLTATRRPAANADAPRETLVFVGSAARYTEVRP